MDEREKSIAALGEKYDKLLDKAREICADDKLTLEVDRCNSYYDVLHRMGRYAAYHYYAQHRETYEYFSKREGTTAELMTSGVYATLDKIYQFFIGYHDHENHPGTFHMHPLSSPYIQIAGDGKTAKLYIFTNGLEALPSPPGNPPFCMWFYDAYCDDMVKEEDGWKWTKVHLMDTIKAPFAVSWSEMAKQPNRSTPQGLVPPSYETDHHKPYTIDAMPSLGDPLPEPYETMDE